MTAYTLGLSGQDAGGGTGPASPPPSVAPDESNM
jgi:hypothetical protein